MTEEELLAGVCMDDLPDQSLADMTAANAKIPVSVKDQGSYNIALAAVLESSKTDAQAAVAAHVAAMDPHAQYVRGTEIGETLCPLEGGVIPSRFFPASYDEVQYFDSLEDFPASGVDNVIYVSRTDGFTWRWGGEAYHRLNASLALGETADTAYPGNKGKVAYDHALAEGNPHRTTPADIGLGNVDNTNDLDKPVSTATSTAISTASTADRSRANHTGTQAASTISDFAASVRSTVLTGLATGTNVAIAATDTLLGGLAKLQAQITASLSTLNSHTGRTDNPHSVTKAQVGLGNVDNTKDLDKPVSTATSSAISTASTADRNRSNHTGTQAASTISDFASTVRSTVLTGLASGTNAAIAATDTLLGGLAKLQAQLNSKQSTLTFDGAPTDGSSNPVTSNGLYDALAGKANAEANSSGWITFTNSTGVVRWLDGFSMSCPVASGAKNYCNQILEVECSYSDNALLQHYTKVYMHMNAQGTSVTFRAETEGDFTYGEIFARHDNGGTVGYLTFEVKQPPYATVRIRRVMADGSAGSSFPTDITVLTAPKSYAFDVPRRNGVNIKSGSSVTLPPYSSIGTTVFVDGSDTGWGGTTVNAPGGSAIYRSGAPGGTGSVSIGAYAGRWFVKIDNAKWLVQL